MWYKGKQVEIIEDFEKSVLCKDNFEGYLLKKDELSKTKEESLAKWEPFFLKEIERFHNLKFGKQPDTVAIKKVYEEVVELYQAIETLLTFINTNGELPEDKTYQFLINRCMDEYGDVIQAGCNLFNLTDAMSHNFQKVGRRIYSDGFKHDEEE